MSHANAHQTFHGRCLLVERVRMHHRPVSHVAKEMGVSRQCAHRWVARFDAEGWTGLHDRSSRARSFPTRTPAVVEAAVVAARRDLRLGRDRIAEITGVPARTVSRIRARHAMPAIGALDPVTGLLIRASTVTGLRYERAAPGDLVHVDVKKLGRIPDGGGWRAHGPGISREHQLKHQRIGLDYIHAVVDDHSRLAYAEIHPDEKGSTAAAVLLRAAEAFASHGVTIREVISDNALAALGARQLFIKPHCPWQNGKVERFNRTLQAEWAYRRPYSTNEPRSQALDPWLHYYNNQRHHHGIGGKLPTTRFLSPTP
ncbi:MAG: IS481 family transposase [Candidatus Nanopelagicales bacterium]|nr:IS481 family transposase [Candidatus Nanopelagicales bacterium]MCF8536792.1 IS481 family transposase [Candidatus Nanopelagicales bacterium]MCF8541777.1 IS481 family transposase [Candidatus Nanopelagicales bacterium]MCF8556182.1 IS481 family transposase [Candidatus Nanopelagicales bacterium]